MHLSDDDHEARSPEELARLTDDLQRQAREARSAPCVGCGRALCGHEALLNVVLGSRHAARCRACLAVEHDEAPTHLCERALQWIRRRECFLHVWHLAGEDEFGRRDERPPCLFADAPPSQMHTPPPPESPSDLPPHADRDHDAGDQGCGELVLELRGVLLSMSPGEVLHVTATDPAAPIDLPAWCGLTGHTMLHQRHPDYWIRRRKDR